MNAITRKKLHSSKFQRWGTPSDFYAWLDRAFGFDVDVCAEKWNHKHDRYWTKADDGLAQCWDAIACFCNPEYNQTGRWLQKGRLQAMVHGTLTVNLVAARVGVEWWRDYVKAPAGRLRNSYHHPETGVWWHLWEKLTMGFYFHDERLTFEHPDPTKHGAPFDSAVVIFAPPYREKIRWYGNEKVELTPDYAARPLLSAGAPWS